MNIVELEQKTLDELRDLARQMEVSGYSRLKKTDLIFRLLQAHAEEQGYIFGGGVLDIIDDGIGFLRSEKKMLQGPKDIYVSQSQIRRFGMRTGDMVVGQVRPPKESEKYYGLLRVEAVNALDPEEAKRRPIFERLTPIFPEQRFDLVTTPNILATRLLNMLAPIGRGQRGLIVSPPKAGKTTILKQVANGITANHSDVHLMVLLIGERPEEVTDMDRSVDAEVVEDQMPDPFERSPLQIVVVPMDREVGGRHLPQQPGADRMADVAEVGRPAAVLVDRQLQPPQFPLHWIPRDDFMPTLQCNCAARISRRGARRSA